MSINLTDEIEVKTKKGKLCAAKQIFLEGDTQTVENEIQDINSRHSALNTKHESLSRTVQGIAVTGGASTANNVTYNNDSSRLNSENAQDAIDEVSSIVTYDVSARNNGAVFESIRALLGSSNLNTIIPTSVRHGGMSIRFIQSSDNKYVQYRLMKNTWSTIVSDWQGIDNEPTVGSDNLVKSGGVANKLSELEETLYGITKNIGVRINSGGSITFDTISIEKEGDAIEFTVYRETQVMPTVIAFCFSAYNNNIAIGASTSLLCIKNTDGNWLSGFNGSVNQHEFTDSQSQAHYKIVWEGSNISLYRDSIFIASAPASTIKINRLGNLTRGVYWTGEVSDFFYTTNNFKTSLFDLPGFSINDNVEIIEETSGGKIKEYDETLDNHGERLIILEEEISHTANVMEESISVEDIYDGLSPKLIFEPDKNITSGGFPDSDIYDSFYFILPNDGKLYVPKMGGTSWMRIAIFGGSLTSHTDYIYKDSTAPDFPNTVDKALAGNEGQYVVISLNKNVKNFNLAYSYAKIEKTLDESIHIPAIINNKVFGKSPIIIKVSNSTFFDVSVLNTNTGKYLTYTFKKYNYNVTIDDKSYIGGDVWNNDDILDEAGNSIAQGNLNFIYSIDGRVSGFEKEGNLHIGPGHGCEVADYTVFLADGKPFTPSSPEVIECSAFRAIWKSKCYAVDNTFATGNSNNYPKIVNSNKVLAAEHYLNAEFKADNIIDWSNKLVVRRNGTVFNALYGGMVQGYSPYFSDVIVNDETASWESWTSDGTVSHKYGLGIFDKKIKGDEVTMWGNGYVIKQKMIQEQVNLNNHSYLYTCRYLTPTRTKVYMIPAKVSLLDSVGSANIFNDGDEINIRLVRKIEIVN